ncbi:MAG: hypothetical protein IH959_01615 [Chloroflexi bacterium]|nr:hypothetical protein [Chloroflexota bacterium]
MWQLGALAAIVIVVGTLYALVLRYNGAACLLFDVPRERNLFLALSILFSLGVVWLIAIPLSGLVSRVVKAGIAARLLALSLAVGVHFSIGALGWAIWTDLPGFGSAGARWAWIPPWIVGAFYKLEVLRECM